MPKRNRFQERKRAERRAADAAQRAAEIAAKRAADKAFVMDPANVLDDALWVTAECGGRHHGPCCSEPICCQP